MKDTAAKRLKMITYDLRGERNREPLVDVNAPDIGKAAREEPDKEVGSSGCADAEGSAAEPLEAEPPLADEGAGVAAGLGIQPPEDLDNQLIRQVRVDHVATSHE